MRIKHITPLTNDQIADYCVPLSTDQASRENILNYVLDALTVKERQEKCLCDDRTGWTTVKCCNLCGYPMPDEKWECKSTPAPNEKDQRRASSPVR